MPWRWNHWQYLYQSMVNSQQKTTLLSNHIFGSVDPVVMQDQDKNKNVIKRLKKKLQLTKESFVASQLQRFGIKSKLTND